MGAPNQKARRKGTGSVAKNGKHWEAYGPCVRAESGRGPLLGRFETRYRAELTLDRHLRGVLVLTPPGPLRATGDS